MTGGVPEGAPPVVMLCCAARVQIIGLTRGLLGPGAYLLGPGVHQLGEQADACACVAARPASVAHAGVAWLLRVARRASALDDVDGQAALGGLLVLREHVVARLAHRFDDDV